MDTVTDPKEFNRKMISIDMEDIKVYHNSDIDPRIEIRIEEANSAMYEYDEVYIYRAKMVCSNAPCYYVMCKAYDQQFLCYDTQFEVGPKRIRQPIQNVNDTLFTLYKVKVINNVWTTIAEDIGEEMMDIE